LGKYIENRIRKFVKSGFRRLGYEITGYSPARSSTAQIIALLNHFKVDLVLDVGANFGQFSEDIRNGGYLNQIVSFEPLTSAHNKLLIASEGDSKWHVHDRCAIGHEIGEITINIAGNSASSSVLPMLEAHIAASPDTGYIGSENTPLLTIDKILANDIYRNKNIFLKIDTQGFEWSVLDGAENSLSRIQGVLVEMSMIPLYEGQHLWHELVARLEDAGFEVWALQPGFTHPVTGRTLQCDGIFFRKD
jgi:FkbM family methyltransferase